MGLISIDGRLFKKMIIAGADRLEANKQLVDSLNVFPVPDGDTGTNMSMTSAAAARDILPLETDSVHEIAKAAAGGALRGARGNSGVILSQFFRGMAKSLEGKRTATCDDLADALAAASETAYKAVMKPKEGTILTVGRVMAERASEAVLDTEDIACAFLEVLKAGNEILLKTTQMLPQLKQANVVDSGGKGLMFIMEGAYEALEPGGASYQIATETPAADFSALATVKPEDIQFIYDTEFFIGAEDPRPEIIDDFMGFLESVGDSVVVAADGNAIKVHVHTNHPGKVLETAMKIGSLHGLKLENMLMQHTSIINSEAGRAPDAPAGEPKETGFIAVSMGAGFEELFRHLEADYIIEGGQTMNPSVEDFITAICGVNADNIIILPNNKNIVHAAKQAAELCAGQNAHVLETHSAPQGIAAMIGYTPGADIAQCLENMRQAAQAVKTGHVTYAVRDSNYGGREIKEGDILGVLEDELVTVSDDVRRAAAELVDLMAGGGGAELISIYYGADTSEEDAEELRNYAAERYPDLETEMHAGKQPLYYYTISAE